MEADRELFGQESDVTGENTGNATAQGEWTEKRGILQSFWSSQSLAIPSQFEASYAAKRLHFR